MLCPPAFVLDKEEALLVRRSARSRRWDARAGRLSFSPAKWWGLQIMTTRL